MVPMTCLRLLNIASGTCSQQNHDLRDWCPLLKGNRCWGRGFGHTTFAIQAPFAGISDNAMSHNVVSKKVRKVAWKMHLRNFYAQQTFYHRLLYAL